MEYQKIINLIDNKILTESQKFQKSHSKIIEKQLPGNFLV